MKKLFRRRRIAMKNSVAKLMGCARIGKYRPQAAKRKPHRVINVAKGTTKIFAKTVIGERIRKL